jgi:hypothetical protein
MFWIENVVFFILFAIYELFLIPFAYMKTTINIMIVNNSNIFNRIALILAWLVSGLFYNFYLISFDIRCLIRLLKMSNGGKQISNESVNIPKQEQVIVLNQARDIVIYLYKTLKKHFKDE